MSVDTMRTPSGASPSRRFELLDIATARPPCRGPRRRRMTGPESEAVMRELGVGADVAIVEWIAMDARETPHISVVRVHSDGATIVARFAKPAAQLTCADARVLLERGVVGTGAA